MLVGEDADGLAAVAWTEDVDGPHDVFVRVVAVAARLRGQGGQHADELLDELKDRLANRADAAGANSLILTGNIDPSNEASRKLALRAGAEYSEMHGAFEQWLLLMVWG
jgi:predicted GNAT superfamily acetyltransferase